MNSLKREPTEFAEEHRVVEEIDVIIIGGGYAGLSALHYLTNNFDKETGKQLSIILIDARARLGGRTKAAHDLCSTCGGGSNVDVGGKFVGPSHQRLLSLVDEFGLTLVDQEFSIIAPSNNPLSQRHC